MMELILDNPLESAGYGALALVLGALLFVLSGAWVIGEQESGLVIKKFGRPLPPGRLIALHGEAGYQARMLSPGWHFGLWRWQYKVARIPVVQTIYGGTKKLMAVLQNKPSGVQRVVLVEFPRRGMKVVGFVTRVMIEEGSGREMAAVYIPTTPNPTGGYLEVVPLDELTPTDWTMDQAMAFIISGGAVAPDTLPASPALPRRDETGNPA